jgi:hypothetical protein
MTNKQTLGVCSFCKLNVESTSCYTVPTCGHYIHFVCTQMLLASGKFNCKTCSASTTSTYQSVAQQSPLVLGTETFRHATLLEKMRRDRAAQVRACVRVCDVE